MKSKILGWIAAAVLVGPMAAKANPIQVTSAWVPSGDPTPLVAIVWHLPDSNFSWAATPFGDLSVCGFCNGTLFADHGWAMMATSDPLDRAIGGPPIFL